MALHLPESDPDLSLNGFVVAVFVVVVINLCSGVLPGLFHLEG